MMKGNVVTKTLVLAVFALSVLSTPVSEATAGEVLKKTLTGAAVGGLVGAVVDGSDGAVKGAAIGGGIGVVAGVPADFDSRGGQGPQLHSFLRGTGLHPKGVVF